jgi:hypothetical protein
MIAPQHPSYISRVARAAGLPHLVPCILFSDGLDGPAVCCAIWRKPRRSLGKQLVGSNTSKIISVWCAAADCGCVTFLGTQHGQRVVPSNKQTLPLPAANIHCLGFPFWSSRRIYMHTCQIHATHPRFLIDQMQRRLLGSAQSGTPIHSGYTPHYQSDNLRRTSCTVIVTA